tara:strand:+ start:57 stop:527 length:471 start_codon:yes stop_codon:yes gene_type:complete
MKLTPQMHTQEVAREINGGIGVHPGDLNDEMRWALEHIERMARTRKENAECRVETMMSSDPRDLKDIGRQRIEDKKARYYLDEAFMYAHIAQVLEVLARDLTKMKRSYNELEKYGDTDPNNRVSTALEAGAGKDYRYPLIHLFGRSAGQAENGEVA